MSGPMEKKKKGTKIKTKILGGPKPKLLIFIEIKNIFRPRNNQMIMYFFF